VTTKKLDNIDFDSVNKLLEGFSQSTGFVTTILDLEGNILSKSGWREICTEFHRINPETAKKCRISDTILASKMAEGEKFHFYQCLNGLVDVAVPIVMRGEHIANLFSGQFFFEKPNILFFKNQAKEFGFDEKKYLEVLKKVPVISRNKIQKSMDFLLSMTEVISELTLHKMEQTELNNALKEREDRLSKIMLASNDGMWDWDLKTNQVFFDPRYYQMSGYEPNEFPHLLEEFQNRIHPDDVSYVMTEAEKHLKEEVERFNVKFRFRKKSGEWQWIQGKGIVVERNDKGIPQRFVGTHRDINELKQTEEALHKSDERFNLAMKASNDGIFDWNLETNDIYYSQSWKKMLGYTDDELPNDFSVWESNTEKKDAEMSWELQQKLISKQIDRFVLEFKMKHKDGHWVDILSKAEAIFDENGKAVRIVGTHTDITERKRAEEEIKQMNEQLELRVNERTAQLEETNKELEAFSYSVSHDLRAPLRHINGYVDLLNERYRNDLPGKAQQYLNNVTDASKQMGTLIDDLLQFSRTGRQEMRWARLDMNVLIKEVLDKVKTETEKREILWDVQHLPKVFGDYALIKQVWINLIDNAVKYSRTKKAAEISIGFRDENKEFVFFIRDNGVGFDMKYAHKLFGVFQRLHSQTEFEGTGIGLANVKRIISKHNGRVWAEAGPDKGATFFFSLPKNKEDHHD